MNQLRGQKRPLPFAAMGLIMPSYPVLDDTTSQCSCECKRFCRGKYHESGADNVQQDGQAGNSDILVSELETEHNESSFAK